MENTRESHLEEATKISAAFVRRVLEIYPWTLLLKAAEMIHKKKPFP